VGGGVRLEQVEELLDGEAALLENVGKGAFGDPLVHWHDGAECFRGSPFLKGDVAAPLAELYKAGALECAHNALT
jgi:hypothetical protein